MGVAEQGEVKGWKVGVPPKANVWVSVHVRLQTKQHPLVSWRPGRDEKGP